MKTCPNHLIRLYVNEKAIPLNASEAISGSPSPWKVFARTAKHAMERPRRLSVSVLLRLIDMPLQDDFERRFSIER